MGVHAPLLPLSPGLFLHGGGVTALVVAEIWRGGGGAHLLLPPPSPPPPPPLSSPPFLVSSFLISARKHSAIPAPLRDPGWLGWEPALRRAAQPRERGSRVSLDSLWSPKQVSETLGCLAELGSGSRGRWTRGQGVREGAPGSQERAGRGSAGRGAKLRGGGQELQLKETCILDISGSW